MAKAGMRRPDPADPKAHGTEQKRNTYHDPKNDVQPVPELQGKAKSTKQRASVSPPSKQR